MQVEQIFSSNYEDYLYVMGLKHPLARGAVAGAAAAGLAYAMRFPASSFQGTQIRPLDKLSTAPNAVPLRNHFLLTPLAVGLTVALLT